ncbi:tautomerase family protein [Rhizobium sp. F40D2]|uniref:tautomerase family protein n=1 Tax=Rhizobium sp. F40D2 TaxID=3453141 RepID=UPI003F2323B0
MPLLKFNLIRGRSSEEIANLLDAAHDAMVEAFNVPDRDRYQIVNEHDRSHFIASDTGLGIDRSDKFVLIEIVSRPRTRLEKEDIYSGLCRELAVKCNMASSDIMITFVANTDEDWSFGHGRAQFLIGEL